MIIKGVYCSVMQIRVWNYNKTPEDVFRGVRQVWLSLDGVRCAAPTYIRPAPGHALFDYGQLIRLAKREPAGICVPPEFPLIAQPARPIVAATRFTTPPVQQDYETPCLPAGQLLKVLYLMN